MWAPVVSLAPRLFVHWGPLARAGGSLVVVIAAAAADGRLRMAALLEKHYERLRLVALRLARTADQADDLAQQAALYALSCSTGLRSEQAFIAWCRTAMAHALGQRRRLSSRELPGFEEVREGLPAPAGAAPPDPLEQAAVRADLLRALATLPEPARWVVILVDVMGLDYGAAARRLGVPIGTLRSRLHRARELLRRRLQA